MSGGEPVAWRNETHCSYHIPREREEEWQGGGGGGGGLVNSLFGKLKDDRHTKG